MGSSYPLAPTFPIDVRADPGSGIVVERIGTSLKLRLSGSVAGGGVTQSYVDLGDAAVRAYADAKVAVVQSQINQLELGSGETPEVYLDKYFIAGQMTWDPALALAAQDLPYGGSVKLTKATHTYLFTSPLVPESITLEGIYKNPPFPGTNQALNLTGLQWIRIKAGGTVTLKAGAGIKGCCIAPENMPFPQPNSSSWVGTAITIAGDQTNIQDLLVCGFDKLMVSSFRSRGSVDKVYFDCNNGPDYSNSYDTTRTDNWHGWPFATIQAYAASLNVLPVGNPNRTVDGYDARINVRSGTGMKFRGSMDDTYVKSAIIVGFMTAYDLEATGGLYFGRIWSECYDRPGSIGFRAGPNVTNVYVEDYQGWSSGAPLLLEMNPTERIVFGHIRLRHPLFAPVTIKGGNLAFSTLECLETPPGSACINIVDSGNGYAVQSRVSGTLLDDTYNDQTPAVLVPAGFIWSNLDFLNIQSYRPLGTSLIGGNVSFPQYLTAAQTVLLPPNGDAFKVTGTTPIEKLGGGYGGRFVTLLFAGPATVNYLGTNGGYIAGSVSGVASRAFPAGGIIELYYDAEYANWREVRFVDFTGPGGAATVTDGSVTNAKLAPVPAISLIGNRTGGTATATYGTLSQFLDTIVASPGVMIARGPSSWQSIGFGTAGQVLTSNGPGNVPSYQSTAGGAFVTATRLTYIADVSGASAYNNGDTGVGTVDEPYAGAVVTGIGANSSGLLYAVRYRYQQYQINGQWFTAGIA